MAEAKPVQPVKLLVAILWSDKRALDDALEMLVDRWGEIDYEGPDLPFDLTDYYGPEMGPDIWRDV